MGSKLKLSEMQKKYEGESSKDQQNDSRETSIAIKEGMVNE